MPGGFLGISVTDGELISFSHWRGIEKTVCKEEVQEMVVETLALDFILFDAHGN